MSSPATILLLVTRLDCNDGVASYLETLITGLAARGDRVIMVSGPVSTLYGSEVRRDAIATVLTDWLVIEDMATHWPVMSQVRQILALIKKHGVTVLGPQGLAVMPFAWVISVLCRKKMVATYHPSALGEVAEQIPLRRPLLVRLAYRAVCKLFPATRYIAASKEIEEFFVRECGIAPRRVHHQVLGIDTELYRAPSHEERVQSRAAFDLSPGTLVCILCGRLNLVKGHDIVVDAIRILRHEKPYFNIRVLFAGAGDQKKQITAYALKDSRDLEEFSFLGFVDQSRLRELYWASDLFLLPSRSEGFGLVVAEAMCCGSVPIRTPSGGAKDQIIDGETGFIVPFNDARALADRIAALSDPALRSSIRARGMEFSRAKFGKDEMLDRTAALYRGVASGQIT